MKQCRFISRKDLNLTKFIRKLSLPWRFFYCFVRTVYFPYFF